MHFELTTPDDYIMMLITIITATVNYCGIIVITASQTVLWNIVAVDISSFHPGTRLNGMFTID